LIRQPGPRQIAHSGAAFGDQFDISLAGGFLISAFVIAGWDGTMYVNEEVTHRRTNPGRAAMWAAGMLVILYTLVQVGLHGVVSRAQLQAHSASVLVYATRAVLPSSRRMAIWLSRAPSSISV